MWENHWQVNDVEVSNTTVLYQGLHKVVQYRLRHKQFKGGWSPWLYREQVQRRRAVVVLLFDEVQKIVVLIEQFRVGPLGQTLSSPWLLECVAGLMDEGETVEDTARREALEEANCVVDTLFPIAECYPSPGAFSECAAILYAPITISQPPGIHGLEEEGEDILVHHIPLKEIPTLLQNGKIQSATTFLSLQWLLLNKLTK
jgi:ADP-ribose pyrophosphatase